MKTMIRTLITCAALLCGFPVAAHAQCSSSGFNNGTPNHLSGNNMGFALQADDFSVCSANPLTGVSFWSLEAAGAYRGSISWSIMSMLGGETLASGTTAVVNRTSLGSYLGFTEYLNVFTFSAPLSLAEGSYWLVLHNGSFTNMGDPNEFLWETTGPNGTLAGMESFDGGAVWSTNFNQHAFQISAVPEPGPVTMLVAGLVLAGCLRRREQAAAPFVS
jgi:hypothetical protein